MTSVWFGKAAITGVLQAAHLMAPYRVAEVTTEDIRLEKNSNWWGKPGEHEQILCR